MFVFFPQNCLMLTTKKRDLQSHLVPRGCLNGHSCNQCVGYSVIRRTSADCVDYIQTASDCPAEQRQHLHASSWSQPDYRGHRKHNLQSRKQVNRHGRVRHLCCSYTSSYQTNYSSGCDYPHGHTGNSSWRSHHLLRGIVKLFADGKNCGMIVA